MKIAAGTKLGPYEIEHAIGAGGMGVVYRADDSRLGRKVAIKVLPNAKGEHFRRFEREARTIGSLNHPNLLTLHDVGDYDGVPFLVTEMLDGESLRARLSKGPLRLREVLKIGAEVARGLAAAHGAGVIHRDVKPDNIFLTSEGRTKILDFGIAKLRRSTGEMRAVQASDIGHSDTVTPTTADTGVVVGTPGYMAPEQLDAGTIDERTDIFSLGVVLYEMICGKRAFASNSVVEESYAILKTPAEPPKGATKALARVVLRCLEKRPDARFQSAMDLAFALDELDASTDPVARISKVSIEPTPRPSAPTIRDERPVFAAPTRRPTLWIALAAALCVLGVLAGILVGRRSAPTAAVATRWPSLIEGGPAYQRVTYHAQSTWFARLAADGNSVLYSTMREGRPQVMRSQISHPSVQPLGVAGRLLDVSSKGEIAVVVDEIADAGGTLARVLEGSGPRAIADRVTAATWLPDGESLAIVRGGSAIEYPIGVPIVKRSAGKLDFLRASPTGDRFAFVYHPAANDTQGTVIVTDKAGVQLVASTDQNGIEGVAWSPDGSEVWFSNASTILALDRNGVERVVLRGPSRLILADVRGNRILVAPSDIRLKMFTGPRAGPFREVGWFDASLVESMSADGSVIAFVEATGTGQNADGYAQFIRRGDAPPTLITNGYKLALLPDASAAVGIAEGNKLWKLPTGVGTPTALPLGAIARLDIGAPVAMSWSGRYVVLTAAEATGGMKLWRIDLDAPTPAAIPVAYDGGGYAISPDGATVAIAAPTGGVQLAPVAGGDGRTLAGPVGEQPLSFTGDGTALFVMHLVGETIEVDKRDVATGARTPWARIVPEQAPSFYTVALDANGDNVTYSTNSDASDLYVLEPSVP
jgi:serine/threonine protein kinase